MSGNVGNNTVIQIVRHLYNKVDEESANSMLTTTNTGSARRAQTH